jgi:citrate lyase alpha subunit
MTPWPVLFSRLPQLVEKLEAIAHPLLTVEVDGEAVARLVRPSRAELEAHARRAGMPTLTPEGWLREALGRVRDYYPEPREQVVLYAGSQPVAVLRRRGVVGHAA